MRNLFKKFVPGTNDNSISLDLRRLNGVQKGLGDKAASYVITGEPATVISTISTTATADPLSICNPYSNDGAERKRSVLFLDLNPLDCELLARYSNVLAASAKPIPDRVLGSDKTPIEVRVCLSEVFLGARNSRNTWPQTPRKEPIKGVTADRLLELTVACGGQAADAFEMLFWSSGYYYSSADPEQYRDLADVSTLVKANPQDAIEGVKRCPADGREAFIKSLIGWDFTGKEPFLNFFFELTADNSKAVREAAVNGLRNVPAATIEPLATEWLAKGKVNARAAMVDVLRNLDSDTARAALADHAKTEKTARIVAAIENALSATTLVADNAPDDAKGYTAIDGTRVDIPEPHLIPRSETVKPSESEISQLRAIVMEENEKIEKWNKENKGRKYFYKRSPFPSGFINSVTKYLTTGKLRSSKRHLVMNFLDGPAKEVAKSFLERVPVDQSMRLAFGSLYSTAYWLSPYATGTFQQVMQGYLAGENADLRAIDQLWRDMELEVSIGGWRRNQERTAQKGDVLRTIIPADSYMGTDPRDIPNHALWPYLADNLDVLDHAFGMGSGDDVDLGQPGALYCLATMPKVPIRYFAPVLEVATGEKKTGKAEARRLLADVPQVSGRLIDLLNDSRQAVRAGSAEWIGQRGDTGAIDALKKRLKKEKSELAKAAILTALQKLGEPLDAYVGPTALAREAETGLKKANFSKLDWINFDTQPKLKFKNGKAVPADIPRWWVFLAFKLKQPGGNALFEIYLDQLDPESATAYSQWIFDSWVNYDTHRASDEEANAFAEKNADARYNSYKRWYKEYTREMAFAELRREKLSDYLNSGAATKGVLALASRTAPDVAAARVSGYLRNHGSRTSQASALLEVLAGKGDPVSLQVIISAATRLKQKGVQAFAGELVQGVADRMNWSLDELADRIVPTAGFDDTGVLDLPCGPDEKLYQARLGDDLTLVLTNPDGKSVKSLPAGKDDVTKASKKQLTVSRKELKQVITMQSARLYEALCAARTWPTDDWQRDYRDHPLMRRLIERVVWQGLDADGKAIGSFRPTAEGELTDAEDNDVDLGAFASLRVAHGANMEEAEAEAWAQHMSDYEVTPLFTQFGRSLMRVSDDQKDATKIKDREGWVLETFKLRGVATKLGYERGSPEDGGWFYDYRKSFSGAGIAAVIEFTGNYLPEENRNCALISLEFVKTNSRMHQPVKLGDVPQVLLSECWNDLHAMADKGAHDPNWEKTCQW